MINQDVYREAAEKFKEHYGRSHTIAAYAPGRVEVIGNHTDYNEGFVLSAAIDLGTFFLAAPTEAEDCRLTAGDVDEETLFAVSLISPSEKHGWSNYVRGVLAGLQKHGAITSGFDGLFLGNIPLGAGLSSSAALEMSSGLALNSLYGIEMEDLELARIGQAAENEYAGVKCGLLDQVSSLFGKEKALVMTDFRSLQVRHVPLGDDACLLMCNTRAKHALVDGEYNDRREKCEEAARFFASVLDHPVAALRDVSMEEWEQYSPQMTAAAARRAAHPIGEDERVLKGTELLQNGKPDEFGKLMFESHESSVSNFENSCPELDTIVNTAKDLPGVMGARLSGGGFGGSVVVLIHSRDVETLSKALGSAYKRKYGHTCDISVITPSAGAQVISL